MAVTTTKTNKPLNPRGNDQSPKGYNRAALYSGKALDFDGVNDSIDISNFSLNGYTAFSICFHKTDDFNNAMIFSSADGLSDGINIYQVSPGYFRARLNGSNTDTDLEVSTKDGFFVLTYDGSNLNWYYQAQNIGAGTTSQTFAIANTTSTIGRQSYAAAQFLNGQIAGFKIFNTALTAAQVADLYNNPEKIVPTGVSNDALKLWLPMQEGAGTTAYDGSGNGNHGTISGGLWVHGIGAPVSQTAVIDWNKGVNLLKYSEKFNDAPNVLDASTYSENEFVSPSGSTDAPKFTETTANDRHGFYQYVTVAAGSISASIFTKEIDRRYVHFQSNATGSGENSYIDLQDGSVVSEGTGWSLSTEDYGNGWYRIKATCTAVAGNKYFIWGVSQNGTTNSYVGDTNYDFTFWGAQVKQSASAGLYVPTPVAPQTSDVLLPAGLTTGRDITGVNLFENVRKQGALNLDGNSWAEVHDNASLEIANTDDVTMEIWFNRLAEPKNNYPKWIDVGLGDSSETNYSFGSILKTDEVFVEWRTSSSGWIFTDTDVTFNKNEWTHLVVTIEMTGANSSIKTYKNGVLSSTKSKTTTRGTGGKTIIGKHRVNQYYGYDLLAQPRIYNRALTAEEVERNYNAGKNIYTNS